MAKLEQANAFLELKQRTNRDVRQLGPLVTQFYEAESTASQTVINLSFAVEQTAEAKKQVQLFVDGKLLREGAGNDYQYSSVSSGQSSQITLSAPIAAGLNIVAQRIGSSIQNFPNPSSVQATLNSDVAQPHLMAQAGLQNFIAPVYRSVSNTTIQNRAQVIDDSSTLKAIAGVERIRTASINLLQNEFGASGERVWEADSKDARVRFVGNWANLSGTTGSAPTTANIGDYIEIHFYGTGLNLVTRTSGSFDFRVSVNGGAEGANIFTTGYSAILDARFYNVNQVLPVVSGLTLGWNTIRIRNATAGSLFYMFGCEILNERSNLAVLSGTAFNGAKRELLTGTSTSAFNAEVVGTRGARVVKYLKDGVIGQAVQEVNPAAAYLTSADHTNEEAVRRINFREFGVGRSDDISTITTTSTTRAFTLEDGTTTLVAFTARGDAGYVTDALRSVAGTSNFITITFVGTGLDIMACSDSSRTSTILVDGTNVGNVTVPNIAAQYVKIVSGLPYGTHTVRFSNSSGASDTFGIADFIIYQPKKPAIPSGAIEIADYNVMANFVANATAGVDTIATGTLRKLAWRENTYVGTWTNPGVDPTNYIGAQSIVTTTSGSYVEYTFFGTGFEFRGQAVVGYSATNAVTLQASGGSLVSLTTTNFPTITSSNYGGFTFTNTTGNLSVATATALASGFRVSGLPLGVYKIRITNNTSVSFVVHTFDIITPIHINQPSLKTGSLSLVSNRNFDVIKSTVDTLPDLSKAKAWCLYNTTTQVILASYNISAAFRKGTAFVSFFFEKPFKTANYVPVAFGSIGQTDFDNIFPNYIDAALTNSAGSPTDGIISIVCFGELADE